MIDIKNKIIYFGYGDIIIDSDCYTITFTQSKFQYKVGVNLNNLDIKDKNLEYVTEPIKIGFKNMQEFLHFKKLLKEIDDKDYTYFEYYDYIFDFSNYNSKSIDVILFHLENIKMNLMVVEAC